MTEAKHEGATHRWCSLAMAALALFCVFCGVSAVIEGPARLLGGVGFGVLTVFLLWLAWVGRDL